MNRRTFDRLPKRLAVSFPLWLIYGTKGEISPYYDNDKAMREHAERGFNCIRIDSGDEYKRICSLMLDDACWTLCKDKLTELNRFFLED